MSYKIGIDRFTGLADACDESYVKPTPPARFCRICQKKLAMMNFASTCFACQKKERP